MFELGLRLAFDKPTIIIKDDKTSYSFDTSPIEHLTYPRDLRFNRIVNFKSELTKKISNTAEKAIQDPNYTTFLKNFGQFTVATLETKEVSKEEFILDEIVELRRQMNRLVSRNYSTRDRRLYEHDRYPGVKHMYSSSDECTQKIAEAVEMVKEVLKSEGIHESLLSDSDFIFMKCKEHGLLPECFDMEECDTFLKKAMQMIEAKTPINVSRKKRKISNEPVA